MRFNTSGLLSKWGFVDGDVLCDFVGENFKEYIRGQELLMVILKKYVIPQIKSKLDIVEIGTNHNPIRTRSVDGVEVDWFAHGQGIKIDPEYVEVPDDILLQEAQKILDAQEKERERKEPSIILTRVFSIRWNHDVQAWEAEIGYREKGKDYGVITKGDYSYLSYDRMTIRIAFDVFTPDVGLPELAKLINPVKKEEIE